MKRNRPTFMYLSLFRLKFGEIKHVICIAISKWKRNYLFTSLKRIKYILKGHLTPVQWRRSKCYILVFVFSKQTIAKWHKQLQTITQQSGRLHGQKYPKEKTVIKIRIDEAVVNRDDRRIATESLTVFYCTNMQPKIKKV